MVNVKKFINEPKYLAAKNAGEFKGKKFTIDAAFSEIVQEKEKICVRLSGIEQAIPLNQTNLTILSEAFGDDTVNWLTHKVILNIVKVSYAGQMVDGIQLEPITK